MAMSTAEVKFIAVAECVKSVIYFKSLISELIKGEIKVQLHLDNQSAIHIIKNGILNQRSKHIDIRYKFICEKVKDKNIMLNYCCTDEQLADLLTKPLGRAKFCSFVKRIIF